MTPRADISYQFRFSTVLTDTGANDIFLYNTGQITSISDATWNRKQSYSVDPRRPPGLASAGHRLAVPAV